MDGQPLHNLPHREHDPDFGESAALSSETTNGSGSCSPVSPVSLSTSPTYSTLSLAMASQVMAASSLATTTEPSSNDSTPADPAHSNDVVDAPQNACSNLYSSPALPSDSKQLAQPVLVKPNPSDQASHTASSALLSVESLASRSASSHGTGKPASASHSVISGASTPANMIADLHHYAQQIQQQILSQQIHQQLQRSSANLSPGAVSSSLRSSPPQMSNQPSATPSTFTSPPDSGRSSPNLSGSVRSAHRPHVLETNKLDIQTHTSGRRMVNQYVIEGELGRGVHGKVRLARDIDTGERVAVKIVEREARKRLGAGLGLLGGRPNRDKHRSRSTKAILKDLPQEITPTAEPDVEDTIDANPNSNTKSKDEAGEETLTTTLKGISHSHSAHFAPLPQAARTNSSIGRYGRWGDAGPSRPTFADREAERQREKEKEKEKSRKALLWTTDQKVRREIAIMKKCCHENVVSLKEVIDDPQSKKIFMVLEYMEGGEIVWKDEHGRPTLTVDEARSILRDVVCGLEYLHYQGIIHRDIKPANLLWGKDRKVKISDFGVSHFSYAMMIAHEHAAVAASSSDGHHSTDPSLADDRELAKTAGSPAFFAPELCMSSDTTSSASLHHLSMTSTHAQHQGELGHEKIPPVAASALQKPKITKAIDVWALGVTLYCLLFGNTPFTAESEYALFAVIPSTDYNIPKFAGSDNLRVGPRKPRWKSQSQWTDEEADVQPQDPAELIPDADANDLSEDARQLRDLLDRLLEKDPNKRITLEEVKKHPWVIRGLQDPPAWLSETDPNQHPFVEISHADVADALTGFSKLKQRVKRWQSKLLDSFASGRKRSKSVTQSSASSLITDGKGGSNASSLHTSRGGHMDGSYPSSPADTFGHSGPPSTSVRTPRTPMRAHSFFGRQRSTHSVGRKEGSNTVKALATVPREEDGISALVSPRLEGVDDTEVGASAVTSSSIPPSPIAPDEMGSSLHRHASALPSPRLPTTTQDAGLMQPPATQRRSSSRSPSAASSLRPTDGPEIPQRRSSDTHAAGAGKRLTAEESLRLVTQKHEDSADSISPSLQTASPQLNSLRRDGSFDGTGSHEGFERSHLKKSFDSDTRSSVASISQASRVSGRHRLGDLLRGTWLLNGEKRHRSLSRPSTRESREAVRPSALSETGQRGGQDTVLEEMTGLSIDTEGAARKVGARPAGGAPASAPLLDVAGEGGSRLSSELLADAVDSPRKISFAAASQPSSPPGAQTFAFDSLGRRQHVPIPTNRVDVEHDDVDLDLDLSDDDLDDDDVHPSGPMLVNSGHGWMMRQEDAYLPEAFGRKDSNASSNDILTPSVEGGYNVYKPPYKHILSPPEGVDADAPLPALDTEAADRFATRNQTYAMDATLSDQAAALRKAEATELQGGGLDSAHGGSASGTSSSAVSRSPSARLQHSNEASQSQTDIGSQMVVVEESGLKQPTAIVKDVEPGTQPKEKGTDESQFDDADEEVVKAEIDDKAPAQAPLDTFPAEEGEDSDENCVSFQAKKKSSRMLTTARATSAGNHNG